MRNATGLLVAVVAGDPQFGEWLVGVVLENAFPSDLVYFVQVM